LLAEGWCVFFGGRAIERGSGVDGERERERRDEVSLSISSSHSTISQKRLKFS